VAVLGVSMRVLFPNLSTPDLASVVMSLNVLGPILGALLIAAVFSAILSTVDSIMIVSGAGLAHDIYGKLINTEATERQKLWANRIAVFALGVLPFLLALNSGLLGGLVQLIVILQASMMGGMFFMPLVLGLHWKRANTLGGVSGMVGGFFTVLFWHIGTKIYSVVPESITTVVTDPVIPGVAVSLILVVGVSLATGKPSKRTLAPFFDDVAEERPAGRREASRTDGGTEEDNE